MQKEYVYIRPPIEKKLQKLLIIIEKKSLVERKKKQLYFHVITFILEKFMASLEYKNLKL